MVDQSEGASPICPCRIFVCAHHIPECTKYQVLGPEPKELSQRGNENGKSGTSYNGAELFDR